jgi:hypothetical protein
MLPPRLTAAGFAAGVSVCLALAQAASGAVAPGQIFVADPDAGSGATGAIFRIDQLSGAQVPVSSGGQFEDPTGVAIGPEGELFVADADALGGPGAVFRVDPDTGAQQVVSSGGILEDPTGIAFDARVLDGTGHLLVADPDSDPPDPDVFGDGNVISIDPATGGQRSVLFPPQGPFRQRPLVDPSGVWPSPQGLWFVTDPNAGEGGSGAVFEQAPGNRLIPFPPLGVTSSGAELVDVAGGTIASDPGLPERRGISVRPVVADPNAAGGSGALVNVEPVGGAQAVVSSGGGFSDPTGIAYSPGPPSRLLVADRSAAGGTGAIFAVDPATGAQEALSAGGSFVEPTGIAVAPPFCRGRFATLTGSPGADHLALGATDGVIAALGGDDVLEGSGFEHVLCGGGGNDELYGDFGERVLTDPRDVLGGGPGNDRLEGHEGRDVLAGDRGRDKLKGGVGPDKLTGGPGRDLLVGGLGKDRCIGGPGRDRLRRC